MSRDQRGLVLYQRACLMTGPDPSEPPGRLGGDPESGRSLTVQVKALVVDQLGGPIPRKRVSPAALVHFA